jgi:hypothetical protein
MSGSLNIFDWMGIIVLGPSIIILIVLMIRARMNNREINPEHKALAYFFASVLCMMASSKVKDWSIPLAVMLMILWLILMGIASRKISHLRRKSSQ